MRDILKQIWRFLRIAASGPGKWLSLTLLLFVIGCQLTVIQVNVRLIHWYADFYNALQKLDVPVIVTQIGVFFALAGAAAGLYLIGRYAKKVLQIRWRRRLTDTLVQGWTSRKAFWFLGPALLGERAIDNPDQRIAEDCNLFCEFILGRDEGSRSGVLDFAMNLVGLYTYATLLWQLSNFTLSFNALGIDFEIPKYMFWVAPLYVTMAITLTHALGHPLSGLLAEEQKREADFRSALIHVRENAPAVAMLNGETAERRMLSARFEDVARIWFQVIRREFIFGLFQRPYFQTVLRIPIFIALPAFLAGKVTLGGLMQLATSFQHVVTNLSWFVFNYKFLSDLVATTRRMQRFLDARAGHPGGACWPCPAGARRQCLLADRRPGDPHARRPHAAGDRRTDGPARTDGLAQRRFRSWQEHAVQDARRPLAACRRQRRIAGRQPLLPAAAGVPAARHAGRLPRSIRRWTRQFPTPRRKPCCARSASPIASTAEGEDGRGLSVGEQQRLALARVLAAKPDWVFLDEATSALDIESERMLMTLLRTELPDATLVVVAHREPQGLANVVRVDLSRQNAEDRALKLAAH